MPAETARTMKAVCNPKYGPPENLRLQDVPLPVVGPDQVLVRVRAASVNPFDWHVMRGRPYVVRLIAGLRGPGGGGIPGVDAAGTVEVVGANLTEFRPGDEVFGSARGTFAEYALGTEREFVAKPPNLSFEQAAAMPGAGVTALQAVREHGSVKAGQNVLINGAAGGVGTFAVQIARSVGARVTAVCSTRNLELVRAIGAHVAIDYTTEDFTRLDPYDVIIDTIGNRSLSALRRVLVPSGTLVLVGGGLRGKLRARLQNRFVSQRLVGPITRVDKGGLVALKELVETGGIVPVLDRSYPINEAPEAIRYVETRRARGKVVITI